MAHLRSRASLLGCMAIAIPVCLIATCLLSFLFFPPTDILGRLYLWRVQVRDAESVTILAGPESECLDFIKQDASQDIARFGGSDIQDVQVSIQNGTGSSDTFQVAVVTFKYRKPGRTLWSSGVMRLETDANYWGVRYLCGNLNYHGP